MDELKDGIYTAKVMNWAIGQTKAGLPQVIIVFNVEGNKQRTWYGTLKEGKGREITLQALLVMGFRGDDLSVLADGPEGGGLDMGREVSLTIATEEYEGKSQQRVRWVNPIGGAAFSNKITKQEAVQKLAGINVRGELMLLRQAQGAVQEEVPF